MNPFPDRRRVAVHLDGYFDNPQGDFSVEQSVLRPHGIELITDECLPEAALAEAEVAFFRAVALDAAALDRLPKCRAVIRYGIGLDKVDFAAAAARGIAVCNVPDFCIEEMADHTLTLALALARRLPAYLDSAREGRWSERHRIDGCSGRWFVTLGLGRIARRVLRRAEAFGWRIAAHDPVLDPGEIRAFGAEPLGFEEALARSDVLSLHCPLTEGTRHLLRRETLARMKPGALLVNTARGGLVETEALAEALASGHLGGAALDVTEPEPLPPGHPLFSLALITPHIAWYSEEAEHRLRLHAAQEALRFFRGEAPHYQVNR